MDESFIATVWLVLFLVSCGKAPEARAPEKPDLATVRAFELAAYRLSHPFLDNGWVVSRDQDQLPQHRGDSLIWTGLALGALPCEMGNEPEAALIHSIEANDGGLVRIEPTVDVSGVSLDGAIGLYRGVAERVTRCPNAAAVWSPVIGKHLAYVNAHSGHLHSDSAATLVPEFSFLLDLLASRLSRGDAPDSSRARKLEQQVSAWALGVNASHASCFRVNLGFLSLQTMESLGVDVSDAGRNEFCAATRGMDIPTVDHWCGRGDVKDWIKQFKLNEWEYRHQRCGGWETPDGGGLETPGLDLLTAMRQAYELP
tara:strand:- start:5439 stop:6377 length:939 start_codon:yes stop_codon:yes gene_type:complete